MKVSPIDKTIASQIVVDRHYIRRKPPISFAFGLFVNEAVLGVVTFGIPASRHMQIGACRINPDCVVELNRLWVDDCMPRNTESWFLSRALSMIPPRIVLSYADTLEGHFGYIYRACNFFYAGWTDMERKTPRFDYISPGRHTRDAFRNGYVTKVRRKPKIKYWTVTGNRRERRSLQAICGWPKMCWTTCPPPTEHVYFPKTA